MKKPNKTARNNMARYESHVAPRLDEIRCWMRDGMTDEELAVALGISRPSVYNYKLRHPEFANALKETKPIADSKVVDSLFKRACGFNYDEVEMIDIGEGKKRQRVTRKYIPPDPVCCIYWLKNRQPERWSDRKPLDDKFEVEVILPDNMPKPPATPPAIPEEAKAAPDESPPEL